MDSRSQASRPPGLQASGLQASRPPTSRSPDSWLGSANAYQKDLLYVWGSWVGGSLFFHFGGTTPKEQSIKTHQTDIHEKINLELSDDWPACGVSKLNYTGMCLFQFKASVPHVCYMFTFRFDSFPVWQRGPQYNVFNLRICRGTPRPHLSLFKILKGQTG